MNSQFGWMDGRIRSYLLGIDINFYVPPLIAISHFGFVVAIPKGIIKKLTTITTIIFYHYGEHTKLHMVSWFKITLPKSKGGTGLTIVSTLNTTCKFKVLWNVLNLSSMYANWWSQSYGFVWKKSLKTSPLWKRVENSC